MAAKARFVIRIPKLKIPAGRNTFQAERRQATAQKRRMMLSAEKMKESGRDAKTRCAAEKASRSEQRSARRSGMPAARKKKPEVVTHAPPAKEVSSTPANSGEPVRTASRLPNGMASRTKM